MKTRSKTKDVAFGFRMGAGFAGDVNRTHPVSIEPCLIDSVSPPTAYGQAVLIDANVDAGTNGVRPYVTGDTSQAPWGVTVRPYPSQQASSTTDFGGAAFGAATPPISGVIDVMRAGYIMVNLPFGGSPAKGGPVYVRVATTSGNHIMGSFEAASDTSNSILLTNCVFNGPADANGNCEIAFNI
jgi:hypothetical protein